MCWRTTVGGRRSGVPSMLRGHRDRWRRRSRAPDGPVSLPSAGCGRQVPMTLDYADLQDFSDVDRGFVGTLDDPVITAADGHVVWDCTKYDFISGDAPATANASLWRQGKLSAKHGLYELTAGVYQVRG